MSLTITDTRISSDALDDVAIRTHTGQWILGGPFFGPIRPMDRTLALAAFLVADSLMTVHNDGRLCRDCQRWSQALPGLLAQTASDAPEYASVTCLYCGSTDVFETRVVVDERTEEMALECGECHGVWAA